MAKEILINGHNLEKQIAIVEDRELVDLVFERDFATQLVGNIYQGRVENVVPGIQAAFVDIGREDNVFLPVNSVIPHQEEAKIEDILQIGDQILIQIDKDPVGTKGPKGSTKLELPGRYLILLDEPGHIGVSRKIEGQERGRLRVLAREIVPEDKGAIIRTEAAYREQTEIERELDYLMELRAEIAADGRQATGPTLLYEELDLIDQVIRDRFTEEVDKLVVDTKEDYRQVMEFVKHLAPELQDRVAYYQHPEPIFIRYNIQEQIAGLLKREVELDCGGYIVIDSTEALTAIDVNTGAYSADNLADTTLQTNLSAARKIATQLRLRNISGIIIIDFIGLQREEDKAQLLKVLKAELAKDKTRTSLLGMTELGLVEVTRKREKNSINQLLKEECSCCQGYGKVLTSETIIQQVFTKLKANYWNQDPDTVLLTLHPELVIDLFQKAQSELQQVAQELEITVSLLGDSKLSKEEIKMEADSQQKIRDILPVAVGDRLTVEVEAELTAQDGLAMFNGYLIQVLEGAALVGSKTKVEITELHNLYAVGKIIRRID
ncbi:Rne/Rng family ribonuclease [Halanaerobaculum tunisiense]